MRLPTLLLLLLACLPCVPALAGGPHEHTTLLRELGDEAARTRARALEKLERAKGLSEKDVAAALDAAGSRARPLLLRLAATRGMQGLVTRIARDAASESPQVSEAAVRALVTLGEDAVEVGEERLTKDARPGPLRRLRALHAQRTVERAVLAKWRRKGGSYLGRYSDIEPIGWPLQPVLLAMLLDVPLEERFIVLPGKGKTAMGLFRERRAALFSVVQSQRRGYRTFDPLPLTIQDEELFDLAAQALTDVGDMSLLGDLLETVAIELKQVHLRHNWKGRAEDFRAQEIEFILASRGRPRLLDRRIKEIKGTVDRNRDLLELINVNPDHAVWYALRLGDLARAYHGGQRFKQAAEVYQTLIEFTTRTAGEASPISVYNLACALARDGRAKAALDQLDKALALGTDDLSREWVAEDGDLHTLHGHPRFEAILDKHYGKN